MANTELSPWRNNGAKRKTHCKRGHEQNETNCYNTVRQNEYGVTKQVRVCKLCIAARKQERLKK